MRIHRRDLSALARRLIPPAGNSTAAAASPPRLPADAGGDLLTEALSRARFKQDLDDAVRSGSPVAVHIADIDGFAAINGELGRSAADALLREAFGRLRSGHDRRHLVARLSNDEFAVAEVVEYPGQVTRTARRILQMLGLSFRLAGRDVAITACVGSAVAPAHGTDASRLLKSADIALRDARARGAGSRSLFRAGLAEEIGARCDLDARLQRAVREDGFALFFQPVLGASDRRLAGFEALLRLPEPDGGHVPPTRFVPAAERLGLSGAIGDWVLRRACATATEWPSRLGVSVNLSPVQFRDGDLVESVHGALAESRLAPRRLTLEITEAPLLSDAETVLQQLSALKRLGVTIALDDFGAGYASLGPLWAFPFDALTIDRTLARSPFMGEGRLAVALASIVAAGRALGMRVTGKGIETEADARFLTDAGCDALQGHLFGRPMPEENVPGVILADFRDALPRAPRPPPGLAREG